MKFNDPDIKYFLSAQNVAVVGTSNGERKLLGEDIRNANGRCIKSRDMFNHADYCEAPKKVIWLQKDTSLPPICRVNSACVVCLDGGVAFYYEGQGGGER